LLEHRAGGDKEGLKPPWPEFAEYDCFACHHDLKAKSWRQDTATAKDRAPRQPGALPWGGWYFSMAVRAQGRPAVSTGPEFAETVRRLQRLMEVPSPKAPAVIQQARAAKKSLKTHLERFGGSPKNLFPAADLFRTFAADDLSLVPLSWDAAAQRYLALAAMHNAWRDLGGQTSPELTHGLRGLRRELRFPVGAASPARFDPFTFREKLNSVAQAAAK
jgi:hypothetical protein